MKVILHPEQTFTAQIGDRVVHGLSLSEEWQGMKRLVDSNGRYLILKSDGSVVEGSNDLLDALGYDSIDRDKLMMILTINQALKDIEKSGGIFAKTINEMRAIAENRE